MTDKSKADPRLMVIMMSVPDRAMWWQSAAHHVPKIIAALDAGLKREFIQGCADDGIAGTDAMVEAFEALMREQGDDGLAVVSEYLAKLTKERSQTAACVTFGDR